MTVRSRPVTSHPPLIAEFPGTAAQSGRTADFHRPPAGVEFDADDHCQWQRLRKRSAVRIADPWSRTPI
ncbi:MAG TPA: hypothetical protein VHX38_40120 [Pseudonocardiaceae bacterium]|jgi:hypothetical protein|nr:hypothetical protein [Pseudonocardiaceae bacterium]